jgi:hypothetical protein
MLDEVKAVGLSTCHQEGPVHDSSIKKNSSLQNVTV